MDADNGLVLLYYHVVGTGTELLSRLQAGDTISLLGPLGHGFDTTMAASRVYVVGGGIGQAPLRYLARVLKEQGKEVVAVMGARDAEGLKAVDFYEANGIPLKLSTEDGSLGQPGFRHRSFAESGRRKSGRDLHLRTQTHAAGRQGVGRSSADPLPGVIRGKNGLRRRRLPGLHLQKQRSRSAVSQGLHPRTGLLGTGGGLK